MPDAQCFVFRTFGILRAKVFNCGRDVYICLVLRVTTELVCYLSINSPQDEESARKLSGTGRKDSVTTLRLQSEKSATKSDDYSIGAPQTRRPNDDATTAKTHTARVQHNLVRTTAARSRYSWTFENISIVVFFRLLDVKSSPNKASVRNKHTVS